jgi:hypothetical protein
MQVVWRGAATQPERQKREKKGYQKQNKVAVFVLGATNVAFNTSVCCCYAFQWKSKAAMLLSGRESCLLLLLTA